MNREIKFRALCDFDTSQESHKTGMVYFSNLELDNGLWFNPDDKEIYHINEWLSKPMQFTGLHDKNGRKIYEGDIVKCHYFYEALGENLGVYEAEKEIVGEIWFQEMGLWIESNDENDSGYLLWINGLHEESFEIIGNIHEHPELLTN